MHDASGVPQPKGKPLARISSACSESSASCFHHADQLQVSLNIWINLPFIAAQTMSSFGINVLLTESAMSEQLVNAQLRL